MNRNGFEVMCAECEALRAERDAYRAMSEARAVLLSAYRAGKDPRDADLLVEEMALDAVDAATRRNGV